MAGTAQPLTPYQPEKEAAPRIALTWLLPLRWGAVVCQVVLVVAVRLFFPIPLPMGIISSIIAFEGISNLVFGWFKDRTAIPTWLINIIMFLDVILLTILVAYTGGSMSPFTFLYLVPIVLGALLLTPCWAWALAGFTMLCTGSFFFLPMGTFFGFSKALLPVSCRAASTAGGVAPPNLMIHLQGMWVAFAITAAFVLFFIAKIRKALERHQKALIRLREEKVRLEKLAALTTLSAGAIHELSTPLGTIAIAAGEMSRILRQEKVGSGLIDDARLIRAQVEKCKEILQQTTAEASGPLGEAEEVHPVRELLEQAVAMLSPGDQPRVEIRNEVSDLAIKIPPNTMRRTLKGLIKNGLEATRDGSAVTVRCRRSERFLVFEIEDRGPGMDRETLAKAADPFFTSKPPGRGMGLGLFLARSVAERYGGELQMDSAPGTGTRATLRLALDRLGVHSIREGKNEEH